MRLGDLDALKAILFNDTQYGFWHDSMNGSDVAYTQRDLFKCIDAMSTIDAVPVVRCKDCVSGTFCLNSQGANYVDCMLDDYSVRKPDDFCSYGEQKEGAGK